MKVEMLSRRDFLRKAGIGILAAAEAGAIGIAANETVGKVSRYSVDWNISAKENDQFLEENIVVI